ncbi:hypothetical protein Tco_0995792 [Tanacetum coccineum]
MAGDGVGRHKADAIADYKVTGIRPSRQMSSCCFRKPAFVCIVVDMSRENASSVERIPSHSDASGGSTVCWASFGEETDEITDLHQILEEVLLTEHGDGIASIKGTLRPHSSNEFHSSNDMISKINILWKVVSEKLNDAPLCDTVGGPTALMNFTSTDYHTKEELRSKGIKSPLKLLSPKYLSQSSIIKQNKNPSSPKRVHFVNSIVILNKKAKEEGCVEPNKTNRRNENENDEEVESEKEVEEETEGETKEEEEDNPKHFDTFPTMKELRYHERLLKNPRPPWVKAKIKTGNVNNVKFSCMIGQFNKEQAYLDLESPINVMSRLHYNWIMSNRLEPRRKPLNPKKNYNFVWRVKGLKVFVRNFTYECDFMVLEDTTSVIDHYLGSVVFGKPFVEATGLVYNKEEGTVVFERDKEKIMFKIPYKIDIFKHIDFMDISTNRIPPFIVESDDDNHEKTHYSDSLDLGPEYKYDEYVCRGIRSLMAAKAKRKNKG